MACASRDPSAPALTLPHSIHRNRTKSRRSVAHGCRACSSLLLINYLFPPKCLERPHLLFSASISPFFIHQRFEHPIRLYSVAHSYTSLHSLLHHSPLTMKYSIAFLSAGAAVVAAQGLGDLPQCGQTCISNMINIAQSQFGCNMGNTTCYCANADFGYGVRDCSNEACSAQDAATVIAFGTAYCQQALGGGGSSSASGLTASATGSAASGKISLWQIPLHFTR